MHSREAVPSPPSINGIVWREARPDDVSSLQQLQITCSQGHGPLDPRALTDYADLFDGADAAPTATLLGVDPSGRPLAFGSVAIYTVASEHRVLLDGLVHPDLRRRGIGSFFLKWGEARGRQMLHDMPAQHPAVLRIDFMDRRDDAIPLFRSHGFEFQFAEDTMRRDLHQTIAGNSPPQGITLIPWTQTDPHLFYESYYDAFRDRPGFPGWSEDTWRTTFTGSDTFCPDLSLLGAAGDDPVGYVLCEIDRDQNGRLPRREGWITQMGVRPRWRGRGVGAALLTAAIRAFQDEGLDDAMLDVNINNPGAQHLYERLGFQVAARRTVYAKSIASASASG